MKTWQAILLMLGLLMAGAVVYNFTRANLVVPLIVGTSIWVGIDSEKLGLIRFRSGIAYPPVLLGMLCAGFWVVAFPWYLSMRRQIKTGKARLRCEIESPLSEGQMSPNGLIQPWRNREL